MPDPVGTPAPPPSARTTTPTLLCRRCGYNLEGHQLGVNVIACLECGLTGPLDDLTSPRDISMSRRTQLLLMAGPSTLCLLITGLFGEFPMAFLVGLLYAVFAPPIISASLLDHRATAFARSWTFIGGTLAGWGANIIAVLAIWLIAILMTT